MTSKNKDIVGGGCIKDFSGNLVVDGSDIKQVWKNYYDKLQTKNLIGTEIYSIRLTQWKDQVNSFPSVK